MGSIQSKRIYLYFFYEMKFQLRLDWLVYYLLQTGKERMDGY